MTRTLRARVPKAIWNEVMEAVAKDETNESQFVRQAVTEWLKSNRSQTVSA